MRSNHLLSACHSLDVPMRSISSPLAISARLSPGFLRACRVSSVARRRMPRRSSWKIARRRAATTARRCKGGPGRMPPPIPRPKHPEGESGWLCDKPHALGWGKSRGTDRCTPPRQPHETALQLEVKSDESSGFKPFD